MIVYRELSSLAADLGFSGKALYSLSNHIERHYHRTEIPKPDGEARALLVPDPFLKAVQRSVLRNLLVWEEISPYATAYRFGGSPRANARPHVGQRQILKLDIRKFFDHLYYPLVKEKAFPAARYSEANRVLLSLLCVYRDALPQGAPTSPAISNIILKDFDNALGGWCRERRICYTRYCDDMTFSGSLDPGEVMARVRAGLAPLGLFLNGRKTTVLGPGNRMSVTGLVVNEKLAVPASYRRRLRQELYYCRKFGVEAHLERISQTGGVEAHGEQTGRTCGPEEYRQRLLGQVRYVLSIQPEDAEMREYEAWLASFTANRPPSYPGHR